MKFLLETELHAHVPVELVARLIELHFQRRAARGANPPDGVKVDVAYGVVGKRGVVAILDAPDADALQRVLTGAPLFHYETMKVTPLCSASASLEGVAASAQAIVAALGPSR